MSQLLVQASVAGLVLPLAFGIGLVARIQAQNPPTPAGALRPIDHPEVIEGPWETKIGSEIEGILFKIGTSRVSDTPGIFNPRRPLDVSSQSIRRQTVDILVYHREGGNERQGWFSTQGASNTRPNGSTVEFDGEHLRIHFVGFQGARGDAFDMDLKLSPAEQGWTGTWSREGQPVHVVLERPHPASGATPSALVGDWEDAGPRSGYADGSLHIRESSDGKFSGWLDRTIAGVDQRSGEPLKITSFSPGSVDLELDTSICCAGPYHGMLSEDGQMLSGEWATVGVNALGPKLNAPSIFRRSH
jgi:hypothetical protein